MTKTEEELVAILKYLNDEHMRRCEPYIDALVKLRARRIDRLSRNLDGSHTVFWDNPDLSYDGESYNRG